MTFLDQIYKNHMQYKKNIDVTFHSFNFTEKTNKFKKYCEYLYFNIKDILRFSIV